MKESLRCAIGTPCPYCDKPIDGHTRRPTRDHVTVARCKGGKLIKSNRLIVCHWCNVNKSQRSLNSWHVELIEQKDPRAVHVARTLERLQERYA